MNDDSPFAAFVPSSPEVSTPAEAKNKKGRKARKKDKKPAQGVATPAVDSAKDATPATTKKVRKPRVTKAPRAMKIDPMLVFGACVGMGLGDVPVIAKIIETLQKLPKKSRTRVIAALAKIFA